MPSFNDINIPFGAQTISIGGVTFICESVNWTLSSTVAERRDEDGDPSGQVFVANFDSGTAVLQLATTATAVPTIGATFTLTRNQSGGATPATVGCVIQETGEVQSQLEIRKVNVNIRRRYNS